MNRWKTMAMVGALAMAAWVPSVGAQTTTPVPDPQAHQDRRELRRDQRDLRQDRQDMRRDGRDIRQDKQDLRTDRQDRYRDRQTVRQDEKQLQQDRAAGNREAVHLRGGMSMDRRRG